MAIVRSRTHNSPLPSHRSGTSSQGNTNNDENNTSALTVSHVCSCRKSVQVPWLGKLGPAVPRRCGESFLRSSSTQLDPYDDLYPGQPQLKKQEQTTACSHLPVELEFDILLRLPAEELQCCCRYVCKRWRDVINSAQFINSHTNRICSNVEVKNTSFSIIFLNDKRKRDLFSIDFSSREKVKRPTYYHLPLKKSRPQLVGSCNGLLCFDCCASNGQKRRYSLYNPATGAFKLVSQLQHPLKGRIDSGFGYDSTNDDYKILCIHGSQSFTYSLRNDSWKVVEPAYPDYVNIHNLVASSMVLSNNSLYWTVSWDHNNEPQAKMIMGFDLGSEYFYEVSLPLDEQEFKHSRCHWYLAPITGCLHLVSIKDCRPRQSEVWTMNESGAWTRVICFSRTTEEALCDLNSDSTYITPYAYSEDGREMLIGVGSTNWTFLSLDLHTQEFRKHELSGVPIDWAWFYKSLPWVGSFVS